MSKVTEITGKIVDYKVKESPLNLVSNEDEMGVITAVVTESEDTPNAIYVGDVHIASGYGLDSPADKAAVNELLQNSNIRELLQGNNNTVIEDDETEEPKEYTNSNITVHDTTIEFINGVLNADSWVKISNVELQLSNGDILCNSKDYQYKISESIINLEISSVKFDFTITKRNVNNQKLFFKVDTSTDQFSPSFNLNNTLTYEIPTEKVNGKTQNTGWLEVNSKLDVNTDSIDNKYPINLIITNEDKQNYIFEKICTVEFLFPIFLTSTTTMENISLNDDERCNYYQNEKETRLSLPTLDESSFNYIWVPTILTNKGFSIIYTDSNIAVNFKLNKTAINLNTVNNEFPTLQYDRYISPWKYIGKISWTIK